MVAGVSGTLTLTLGVGMSEGKGTVEIEAGGVKVEALEHDDMVLAIWVMV